MTVKQQVISRIQELPDEATFVDIREEIEILSAIEEGLIDVRDGRTKPQREVEALLESWTTG